MSKKKKNIFPPVASNLATLILKKSSGKGETIKIPILGIKIKPKKN